MADATLSDRLVIEIGANLAPLSNSLAQAAREVNAFAGGTIASATRDMTNAFQMSFGALERSILKAARTGQFSIREMVNAILADLARVAIQRGIVGPLENAAESIVAAIGRIISGRALGGPVAPANAYLVGERGPELFVPSGNGSIVPGNGAGSVRPLIVLNVTTPDARSFLKSETQISAMLARAAARGQRNL